MGLTLRNYATLVSQQENPNQGQLLPVETPTKEQLWERATQSANTEIGPGEEMLPGWDDVGREEQGAESTEGAPQEQGAREEKEKHSFTEEEVAKAEADLNGREYVIPEYDSRGRIIVPEGLDGKVVLIRDLNDFWRLPEGTATYVVGANNIYEDATIESVGKEEKTVVHSGKVAVGNVDLGELTILGGNVEVGRVREYGYVEVEGGNVQIRHIEKDSSIHANNGSLHIGVSESTVNVNGSAEVAIDTLDMGRATMRVPGGNLRVGELVKGTIEARDGVRIQIGTIKQHSHVIVLEGSHLDVGTLEAKGVVIDSEDSSYFIEKAEAGAHFDKHVTKEAKENVRKEASLPEDGKGDRVENDDRARQVGTRGGNQGEKIGGREQSDSSTNQSRQGGRVRPRPQDWRHNTEGSSPRRSRENAARIFREVLPRLSSSVDAAVTWAEEVVGPEIAAVEAGRKPVFHEYLGDDAVEGFNEVAARLRDAFPNLHIEAFDGHLIVVHPEAAAVIAGTSDVEATLAAVREAARSDRIGEFLGYGLAHRSDPGAIKVELLRPDGSQLGGFLTNKEHAKEFADDRALDYSQALGIEISPILIELDGNEAKSDVSGVSDGSNRDMDTENPAVANLSEQEAARFAGVERAVADYFDGSIPDGVHIVWEPDNRASGVYHRDGSQRIEINAAKARPESAVSTLEHEIGHLLFEDADLRSAFDTLWEALPKKAKAGIEGVIGRVYKNYSPDLALEESRVRALQQIRKAATGKDASPALKRAWDTFVKLVADGWRRFTGKAPVDAQGLAQSLIQEGVARLRGEQGGLSETEEGAGMTDKEADSLVEQAFRQFDPTSTEVDPWTIIETVEKLLTPEQRKKFADPIAVMRHQAERAQQYRERIEKEGEEDREAESEEVKSESEEAEKDEVETPAEAAADVKEHLDETAEKSGAREFKDIKKELLDRITAEIDSLSQEGPQAKTVTIDIPGDGTFTILRNRDALEKIRKRVARMTVNNSDVKLDSSPRAGREEGPRITTEQEIFDWAIQEANGLSGATKLLAEAERRLENGERLVKEARERAAALIEGKEAPQNGARGSSSLPGVTEITALYRREQTDVRVSVTIMEARELREAMESGKWTSLLSPNHDHAARKVFEKLTGLKLPSGEVATREAFAKWYKSGAKILPTNKSATVSESENSPVSKGEELPTKKSEGAIEDFGEKIGGARKDMWGTWREAMEEGLPDDMQNFTLSKNWPEPNYEKLIEGGMDADGMATIKALRDMIPPKPRTRHKFSQWANLTRGLYQFARYVIENEGRLPENYEELLEKSPKIWADIEFYRGLGFPAALKAKGWGVTARGGYSTFMNQPMKPGDVGIVLVHKGRMKSSIYRITNEAGLSEAIREIAAEARELIDAEANRPKSSNATKRYAVYDDRKGTFFIGRKGLSRVIRVKTGFQTVREAYDYIKDNVDALEEQWDGLKKTPEYRRSANEPRKGPDRREGEVSPDLFHEAFGFRGVEFGNWVENARRQEDLNESFDALMDLADVLGIPAKALSLDGSLGMAFGARGHKGAIAHYEQGKVVINLTKKRGPGSLAHEWWHAFDNYFARVDRTGETKAKSVSAMATEIFNVLTNHSPHVRQEIVYGFIGVVKALEKGSFAERSEEIDQTRSKPYYSTMVEKSARAFERYIRDRMEEQGLSNDYLVNLQEENNPALPTAEEMDGGIREAFDNLFNALAYQESATGVRLYAAGTMPLSMLTAVREVDATIAKLPARAQRVIEGMGDGMSPSELASELGMTADGVERLYKNATKLVKAQLDRNVPKPLHAAETVPLPSSDKEVARLKAEGRIREDGKVNALNGKPSKLYQALLDEVKDPARAQELYALAHSEEFREVNGDWEKASIRKFLEGPTVAAMRGNEVPTNFPGMSKMVAWVSSDWKRRTGGVATHPNMGDIVIDQRAASRSAWHGMDPKGIKQQAFYLVPDIIQKGVLLGQLEKKDTSKPDAFLIAAPVQIGELPYYGLVELRRDENMQRLYVHEAVLRSMKTPGSVQFPANPNKLSQPQAANPGAIATLLRESLSVNPDSIIVKLDENGEPVVTASDIESAMNGESPRLHSAETFPAREAEIDATIDRLRKDGRIKPDGSVLAENGKASKQYQSILNAVNDPDAALRLYADTKGENFRKWFGDSKVVDGNGEPLVVYHGTDADFDVFRSGAASRYGHGMQIPGMYFSESRSVAELYGRSAMIDGGRDVEPRMVSAYLRLQNPKPYYVREDFESADRLSLEKEGADGVVLYNANGVAVEIVAFDPTQIKSATENDGAYSLENPSILHSAETGPVEDSSSLPPIELTLEGWSGSASDLNRMARSIYASELQGTSVHNGSLDELIVFSSEGKSEAYGPRGKTRTPARAELVKVLRDLVGAAVDVEKMPPLKGRESDSKAFYTLVAPLSVKTHESVEGEESARSKEITYAVKVTVREALDSPTSPAYKFYDVTIAEIERSPDALGFRETSSPRPVSVRASRVSISDLAAAFNINYQSPPLHSAEVHPMDQEVIDAAVAELREEMPLEEIDKRMPPPPRTEEMNVDRAAMESYQADVFDAVAFARDEKMMRESFDRWDEQARLEIDHDRAGVIRRLLEAAKDKAGIRNAVDTRAAMMLLPEMRKEAMARRDAKALAEVQALEYAFLVGGTENARALAARRFSPYRSVEERHLAYIGSMLSAPLSSWRNRIEKAMTPKEKADEIARIKARIKERIEVPGPKSATVKAEVARLQAELKRMREQEDKNEVLAKAAMEKLARVEEALTASGLSMVEIFNKDAVVKLRSSAWLKRQLDAFGLVERKAIRAMINGHTPKEIAKLSGIHADRIEGLRKRFRDHMGREFGKLADRGLSLADFDGNLAEGINAVLAEDGRLHTAETAPDAAKAAAEARAAVMQQFESALGLTDGQWTAQKKGRVKRIDSKKGEVRFDPRGKSHALQAMRPMQAAQAYRIANAEGRRGAALDSRIGALVSTPGSAASRRHLKCFGAGRKNFGSRWEWNQQYSPK